jgi:DNA-binding transcriptional ArsR family regulator
MVTMTEPSAEPSVVPPELLPTRIVRDVQTLKVLSDPVRLAILRVLMESPPTAPKVRSVKELAAELGEPQTKLYRHVKQLEASDLIHVAETRLVSGIVEHRYRAGQWSLDMDPKFFGPDVAATGEAATAFATIMDNYRNQLVADITAGRVLFGKDTPGASYRAAVSAMTSAKVPAARAAEFRDRLAALVHDVVESEHDEDGVRINFLASFYGPVDPE